MKMDGFYFIIIILYILSILVRGNKINVLHMLKSEIGLAKLSALEVLLCVRTSYVSFCSYCTEAFCFKWTNLSSKNSFYFFPLCCLSCIYFFCCTLPQFCFSLSVSSFCQAPSLPFLLLLFFAGFKRGFIHGRELAFRAVCCFQRGKEKELKLHCAVKACLWA